MVDSALSLAAWLNQRLQAVRTILNLNASLNGHFYPKVLFLIMQTGKFSAVHGRGIVPTPASMNTTYNLNVSFTGHFDQT